MAETTFDVLLVAILWLLLGRGAPGWKRAALVGVLIGAAFTVRAIGLVLLVAVVLYLIVVGNAWRKRRLDLVRRTAAAIAGFAVVFGAYAIYYHADTGRWGFTGAENQVLYGRTAVVANCAKLPLNEGTRLFCPKEPLGQRLGVDKYAHNHYGDPNWPGPLPPGTTKRQLATEFARLVIRHQPLDVTWAALKDFAKGFAPTRTTSPDDVPLDRWQFQLTYPNLQDPNTAKAAVRWGGSEPHVVHVPAEILRAYQLHGGYTSGSLLGLCVLIALAAVAGLGRAKTSGLRSAALLPAAAGVILLLGSAAFEFSWRYQLPGTRVLPAGGSHRAAGAVGQGPGASADGGLPGCRGFPCCEGLREARLCAGRRGDRGVQRGRRDRRGAHEHAAHLRWPARSTSWSSWTGPPTTLPRSPASTGLSCVLPRATAVRVRHSGSDITSLPRAGRGTS